MLSRRKIRKFELGKKPSTRPLRITAIQKFIRKKRRVKFADIVYRITIEWHLTEETATDLTFVAMRSDLTIKTKGERVAVLVWEPSDESIF